MPCSCKFELSTDLKAMFDVSCDVILSHASRFASAMSRRSSDRLHNDAQSTTSACFNSCRRMLEVCHGMRWQQL